MPYKLHWQMNPMQLFDNSQRKAPWRGSIRQRGKVFELEFGLCGRYVNKKLPPKRKSPRRDVASGASLALGFSSRAAGAIVGNGLAAPEQHVPNES
jgi:hypothetical protein